MRPVLESETDTSLHARGASGLKATAVSKENKLLRQTVRRQRDLIAALRAATTGTAKCDEGARALAEHAVAASRATDDAGNSLLDAHLKRGTLAREIWDTNLANVTSLLKTGGMRTGFRYSPSMQRLGLKLLLRCNGMPRMPPCPHPTTASPIVSFC